MFTAGGGPGEVHSYFSPFGTPADAFVTAQAAILDFENRVRLATITADEPFLFYTGTGEKYFTGKMVWSLKGLTRTLEKVSTKSIEFHNKRMDFEQWAKRSLHDDELTRQLEKTRLTGLIGEQLRQAIVKVARKRLEDLMTEIQSATRYF
jgi:alpha-amylase